MKKVKKENKEKIMEMIRRAGSEEYETSWNEAGVFSTSKKKSKIKKGKTSRARGARFELKVRKDLEEKGRIVDKWNNNVDLEIGKLIIAKRKFNPFSKAMTIGTGFPDFISIKKIYKGVYSVIGVEVKMNGILSKKEKEKCVWYLKKEIFSRIWIAKAVKKGKNVKAKSFGVKRSAEKGKTYLAFGVTLDNVSVEPIYIHIEAGVPKLEISTQAKVALTKVDPDNAKMFRAELITVQERVLDEMDSLLDAIDSRDKYLSKLEGDIDAYVAGMTPLHVSMLKQLLVKKYRKL